MKRKFIALFLLVPVLCCAGCASDASAEVPTEAPTAALTVAADSIPAELVGTWSSASSGELDMTETFTFYDDGTFSAYAVYRDTQTQALTGTFTVGGHTLYCEITGGAAEPYTQTFDYRIDGRELYLTDAEGESHFLRTS